MKRKKLIEFLIIFLSFIVAVFLGVFIAKMMIVTPDNPIPDNEAVEIASDEEKTIEDAEQEIPAQETFTSITTAVSSNCTIKLGYLMLINPNFHVETDFIAARKAELISLSYNYGIREANPNNGDNLMDPIAAAHLYEMVNAYKAEYPGHEIMTRSCFRVKGTNCGRLCLATGTTDHHTGLTCDLIDQSYGSSLDTSLYNQHVEWQWLKANSYKYGFIDRFPADWSGGPMSEPMNVDASGSTGLYETWHYRYVGEKTATEIATGKYNNGKYDSLEHYLKARGLVTDLVNATCKSQ
ncbi:D-alanyl-D-alanine carboxypeptidase family protein [Candidatus Saccharibacteria bacterium]|nr:D-alanyl-D-alanine carboxypeptidase family protein [Candidatus Saccharibacteria bacterium]